MEELNHSALNCLLKANSKEIVIRLCNEAFLHRNSLNIQGNVYKRVGEELNIDEIESQKLMGALSGLIKNALFLSSTKPAVIASLFPENFHKNLRDLLGRILIENIPNWKTHAINNLVSLPRLVDFDWRVDIKTSSDSMARMSVPTCILQMQVQECPAKVDKMPPISTVNVELSKETLDTMLDGLGKIRDQLSSVANK